MSKAAIASRENGNGNVRRKIDRFEEDEKPPIDMKNFKNLNGSKTSNNSNNVGSTSPSPLRVARPSAPPAPPPVYSSVFTRKENLSLVQHKPPGGPRSPDVLSSIHSDSADHEYDTIDETTLRGRPRQEDPTPLISHTHLNITDNRNSVRPGPARTTKFSSAPLCNFTRVAIGLGIICLVQLIILIILTIHLLSSKDNNYSGKNSITQNNYGHAKPGELIFYDDFETLNLTTWRHDRYLSHDGFVIYGTDPKNSYVEDGLLFIEPTFTQTHFNASFLSYGVFQFGKTNNESCSSFIPSQCQKAGRADLRYILNPIMSATLRTSQSFTFKYGTIEIRAKMPKGDWISTEISLRPRYKYFGEPTDSAQIVLITSRGNSEYYAATNNTHYGNERFCSQLVYSDAHSTAIHSMVQFCQNSEPGDGFAEDFHTYKFDWTPELMKIFVDDKMTGKFIANSFVPNHVKHIVVESDNEADDELKSSFDQQFYIQLKVAVAIGFPDTGFRSSHVKPWNNNDPNGPYNFWYGRRTWASSWLNQTAALQIDYIKVKAL